MNKRKIYHSDFLFASPSFLIGWGSVLNIAGNYFSFNSSRSSTSADFRAIVSDWGVTGQDIERATKEVSKGLSKKDKSLVDEY